MARGLLFLIIVGLLVLVVFTWARRERRRRDESSAPPPPAPVPAPALPDASAQQSALTSEAVLHKLNELAFARELKNPQPAHPEVIDAVTKALESAAVDPRYAPRRPLLLPQLLRAVNDTETSRRELATMIATDPALVGGLLKLANSSFYRHSPQPVESVDRAVALIGTDGIRSLIAAALVQPVFSVSAGEFALFPEVIWDHTFLAAKAAETYAAVVVNSDPFAAQLLALLNGLGAIVVFRVTLDQYAMRSLLTPDAATIIALLDTHSAAVARRIAASWDLSGRILAALEDQIPGGMAHDPTPLGRALRFGRLVGALAVLHTKGVITDETARATLAANGASGAHFERIWERLTGKPPKLPPDERRPLQGSR